MESNDLFDPRPKVKKNVLPTNPEAKTEGRIVNNGRCPSWLHRKLPKGDLLWKTNKILDQDHLPTVCEEAKCPNLLECFSKKTATFLTLGKECTRNCGFCDIDFSKAPKALDPQEPQKVALASKKLGLKHVVLTMVARDDLSDGGARQLSKIIGEIRKEVPEGTVEVLTSDFEENYDAIDTVISSDIKIFNYNLETVRELTPRVRHKATYERTLNILKYVKKKAPHLLIKSGIMVGLGETKEQVFEALVDLQKAGCDVVTIGQYLQPNPKKLRVKAFITPKEFEEYSTYGRKIGIKFVYSGPFVRSSYNADLVQRKFEESK